MTLKRHLGHVLATVLAACSPPTPARIVEARRTADAAPRGPARLREAMLTAHDEARRAVGVAPLAWSEGLVADAAAYAKEMAASGRFAHADQPQGPGREGENLWMGTRGAYRYDEMIAAWTDEGRAFIDLPTPDFSRTGRWQDVGHYTQIIWRGTTAVGCAVAAGPHDEYLVCRYAPPGNVMGARAL